MIPQSMINLKTLSAQIFCDKQHSPAKLDTEIQAWCSVALLFSLEMFSAHYCQLICLCTPRSPPSNRLVSLSNQNFSSDEAETLFTCLGTIEFLVLVN